MGHEAGFSPRPEDRGKKAFFSLLLSSVSMGHALLASIISELCLTNPFLMNFTESWNIELEGTQKDH